MEPVFVQSMFLHSATMDHGQLMHDSNPFVTAQTPVPYVAIPLKRSLDAYVDDDRPSCSDTESAATMVPTAPPRSPALSMTSSELSSITATPPPFSLSDNNQTAAAPARKRRRLTPAEKAENERIKTEKRARREQERAEREDQKRVKDEARRQKNEEAEEKKRERDLKRQEKDHKKQQEEEEKAKKERAQSRINAFFAKPKPSAECTPVKMIASEGPDAVPAPSTGCSGTPSKPDTASDYHREFLPFVAPSTSTIAPHNRFFWDPAATEAAVKQADALFKGTLAFPCRSLVDSLELSPFETTPRGAILEQTSSIFSEIDGSSSNPVDLESRTYAPQESLRDRLRRLPMKYIYFHEDVRPPYLGTMSKEESRLEKLRTGRRPFRKAKESLDYDYDSEAEWEEPEEGEDLESEGEEESESVGDAEELDEFLDDEGTDDVQRSKKRLLTGDMQPVSTGLCWESASGSRCDESATRFQDARQHRMESLLDVDFPINPFAHSYWLNDATGTPATSATTIANTNASTFVRPPLHSRPNIAINGLGQSTTAKSAKTTKASKSARALTGLEFELFKEAVQGSDLNKAGMLAVLKKRLPKVPNAVLSEALGNHAARVGVKEVDKKWVVLNSLGS